MRIRNWSAALFLLALVTISCSDRGALAPVSELTPQTVINADADGVRISEIHYDNASTDAGEAIEVSGVVGTDLTGWSIVLYNGNGGAVYDTDVLSGSIQATVGCSTRGVLVLTYPSNGIQNGSPDGIALVDAGGTVVEFLSYEGEMTAVGGAANGQTSTNLPIIQGGSGPLGESMQRNANNEWVLASETFGECNAGEEDDPAPGVARIEITPAGGVIDVGGQIDFDAQAFDASDAPIDATIEWSSSAPVILHVDAVTGVASGLTPGFADVIATSGAAEARVEVRVDGEAPPPAIELHIVEVHYDNDGTDTGEAFEVRGPAGASVAGWSVVLYNGNGNAPYGSPIELSGVLPSQCAGEGTLSFAAPGMQNGAPDGIALVGPDGVATEFLSYEGPMTAGSGPANGMTSTQIGEEDGDTPIGYSLQLFNGEWIGPHPASFDACNTEPPPPPRGLNIFGRDGGDPALPVGFEDQLFASYTVGGNTVQTTITWSSETPSIATVDQDGVVHVLAAGTAVIRATAADGTTNTHSLATAVATAGTAVYGNHVEFGVPADGDASNDFQISYPQYRASFDAARGIPNWVSFNLEATHIGAEDRCDCFTFDPNLPADFQRYTTADYTGAGSFHGFGIDRGHLVRSFDRTSGTLDNANTYYFSNIIPQTADNNQGPWSDLEFELGNMAQTGAQELYVIAGASGGTATVKNEGLITIPDYVWKVAVIMPRDQGLNDVDSYDDVQIIAVIMPNVPGIRNVPWQTYQVTVDEVEALSGYDVLSLLADEIEVAVEGRLGAAYDLVAALGISTNSLNAKLDAAVKSLAKGNETPAANQLNALLNELNALVQSGRATAEQVQPLRSLIEGVIASIQT